jgi:hypothetical protein
MKSALVIRSEPLAAKKRLNGLLAIQRRLKETTEIVGALEHLALRIFFIVEVFLRLFKDR